MLYLIDIVGTCNLRCPSCPVGNFRDEDFLEERRPKGFMEIDLFSKILTKINEENPRQKAHLNLYNWGEAFIHPEISLFLEEISKAGLTVETSSNFNGEFDLRSIVKAYDGQITKFRISLSGFHQETYKKGHRGGSIDLVKSNLYRLRHYMDLYKKDIPAYIFYHLYRDNTTLDISAMERLCSELGFGFQTGWAYIMPIEKMMTALNVDYNTAFQSARKTIPLKQAGSPARRELSKIDRDLISRLVMPVEKMAEIGRQVEMEDCPLRSEQTVINYDGSVALCCGVYDPVFTVGKSFLDLPQEVFQKRKYEHPMCDTCFKNYIPQIATQAPGARWDAIGNQVLEQSGASAHKKLRGIQRAWAKVKKHVASH